MPPKKAKPAGARSPPPWNRRRVKVSRPPRAGSSSSRTTTHLVEEVKDRIGS